MSWSIHIQISLTYLEVELLDDRIDNAQLFSQITVPVYTRTGNITNSGCSAFSLTLDMVSSFNFSSLVVWVYNFLISIEFEPLLRCLLALCIVEIFLLFFEFFS